MNRKRFSVLLTRDYAVEISAKNVTEARECAEYFLTSPVDGSTKRDRKRYKFEIERITSISNDGFVVEDIDDGKIYFKY